MVTATRVENVDHFVDENEGFFQIANHFKVNHPMYEHHFLISEAKYFPTEDVSNHFKQLTGEQTGKTYSLLGLLLALS